MHTSTYHLVVSSTSLRTVTSAWLLLGLASLVGAGLFSLLLVLARTPAIQHIVPLADFFRVALVVHVNLSVLIWLLSMAGMFWSLACKNEANSWDRVSFSLALLGTVTIVAAPFLGASNPLMNNYVPVLQHPVFYTGMALFTAGILFHLLRCSLALVNSRMSRPGALTHGDALRIGIGLSAVVTAVAICAFLASLAGVPRHFSGEAYFEFLFWGGGHVLQFTHVLLMMLGWVVLASASGCRFVLTPRLTAIFFIIVALPIITVPFLYAAHEVESPGHRLAFTELMKYGGLSCLPLGLAVMATLWKAGRPEGEGRYLRAALWSSIALFAVGGVLGFLISGLDIVIPAHYHGSTVGVTIAYMGICYYLLPRLGFGVIPQRLAFWQPVIYASGQLMHIAGLAWNGG